MCPILFIRLCKRLVLAGLFVALTGWPLQEAMCDIDDDFIREGIERMRNGRYREAIVYFEAARNSAPDDKNIKMYLASAYHKLAAEYASGKDWHNAVQTEELALKNSPADEIIKAQLGIFYNNYGLEYAEKESYDSAKDCLRKALEYDPDSKIIKPNLYNVTLKEADYYFKGKDDYRAQESAKEAILLIPDNAAGYIFLGNIYYQQDNFKGAVVNWEKALAISPENTDLKARIEKLKREEKVEAAFKTKQRQYFKVRFERDADTDYIWAITDILEDARRKLRNEFDLYTGKVIPVIVYTGEQFREATDSAHWTLGLYDGKIRLNQHDIARGDEALRRTLYHEYAHAIVYLVYGGNIPSWLHEGFAQYCQPEELLSTQDKGFLQAYMEQYGAFSLEDLDAMFAKKNNAEAQRAAYMEAKIFVDYLIDRYRKYGIKRLFEELKQGKPWQEALREVYHKDVSGFNRYFNEYLQEILAA